VTVNLLVTGGTGFVGRHLVEFLRDQRRVRVRAVSRRGGGVGPTPVDAVNLAEPGALAAWGTREPRFDAIFHLAARLPVGGASVEGEPFAANVAATRNVLSLAEGHEAFMVYASSAYVYEPGKGAPVDESQCPLPSSPYYESKLAGEELCREARGVRGVQLRIAAVYGPGQTARTVLRVFIDRAKASEDLLVHGSGRRSQDFLHVSDLVRAMWQAFQAKSDGVFNMASGTSIAMWDLAHLVQSCVPGSSSVVRRSGEADPQDDVRWAFSIERARERFGFAPTVRLEDGIRQLAQAS
jgi:nucleoside-diphosphate-sugar epimerase